MPELTEISKHIVIEESKDGLNVEIVDQDGRSMFPEGSKEPFERTRRVVQRLANGNVYVNRNMVGAVVGTQPFGGTHLSGTGPKAGGPNYLRRFAAEQVVTVNTAAAGGNASLLAQEEQQENMNGK